MLITFEGIDGSGKSTLARGIFDYLQKEGKETVISHEPGGTPVGESIRSLLLNKSGIPVPMAEALLYIAARAQLMEKIVKPALNGDRIVLLDRFYDSTYAYQGYGHGLDLDFLRQSNHSATSGIVPQLTLLLDLDPLTAATRLGKHKDRMEEMDLRFHHRVRNGYLQLAKKEPKRFFVIDACLPVEEILALTWSRIKQEV